MAWAKACSNHNLHPEEYIVGSDLLTSYKNRVFYHLLHQHRPPCFHLDNVEGKHQRLAYCCLATGHFIDPNTGSISSKTDLIYRQFTQNGIITKDRDAWPKDTTFLVKLDNMLNGSIKCHVLQKCSTVELYYISSPPQEIPSNDVMSALITLNKQISYGKLASNRPHPMDLCAQFVKSLAKKIVSTSFDHTPNMSASPCELTTYLSTSGIEKLIKNNGPAFSSESSLMKYFKQLDELVVQYFISIHLDPNVKWLFSISSHISLAMIPPKENTHLSSIPMQV
jgi:hypothetical protein